MQCREIFQEQLLGVSIIYAVKYYDLSLDVIISLMVSRLLSAQVTLAIIMNELSSTSGDFVYY